jgi:hypothetical protein
MGGCGVRKYEGNYSLAVERIEQLEGELKNKDAVRLWNENEKLKEANRILREGLEFYATPENFENGVINSIDIVTLTKTIGRIVRHYSDIPTKEEVWVGGRIARAALEQADKIMKGGEG